MRVQNFFRFQKKKKILFFFFWLFNNDRSTSRNGPKNIWRGGFPMNSEKFHACVSHGRSWDTPLDCEKVKSGTPFLFVFLLGKWWNLLHVKNLRNRAITFLSINFFAQKAKRRGAGTTVEVRVQNFDDNFFLPKSTWMCRAWAQKTSGHALFAGKVEGTRLWTMTILRPFSVEVRVRSRDTIPPPHQGR